MEYGRHLPIAPWLFDSADMFTFLQCFMTRLRFFTFFIFLNMIIFITFSNEHHRHPPFILLLLPLPPLNVTLSFCGVHWAKKLVPHPDPSDQVAGEREGAYLVQASI